MASPQGWDAGGGCCRRARWNGKRKKLALKNLRAREGDQRRDRESWGAVCRAIGNRDYPATELFRQGTYGLAVWAFGTIDLSSAAKRPKAQSMQA